MNRELAKVLNKDLTAHLDDLYEDAICEVATRFADKHGFTCRRVHKVYRQHIDNVDSNKEDPVPDFRSHQIRISNTNRPYCVCGLFAPVYHDY